ALYNRLQVAVLLKSFGDERGIGLIRKAALDKPTKDNRGTQYYAVSHLPEIFGDKAAAIICDHVRQSGQEGGIGAWQAMCRMSADAAIPELRKLMDRKEPIDCQLFAIGCMRIWGPASKGAVPHLIRVLERPPLT